MRIVLVNRQKPGYPYRAFNLDELDKTNVIGDQIFLLKRTMLYL